MDLTGMCKGAPADFGGFVIRRWRQNKWPKDPTPPSVHELYIMNCPETLQIPENLFPRLRFLYLENDYRHHVTIASLPSTVEDLVMHSISIDVPHSTLPKSLKILTCHLPYLPFPKDFLPDGLEELNCDCVDLKVLGPFPSSLVRMKTKVEPSWCLSGALPEGLKKLEIQVTGNLPDVKPGFFPSSLEILDITGEGFLENGVLPEGLVFLTVRRLIPTKGSLPASLKRLSVMHLCAIDNGVYALPEGLERLDMSTCQFDSIAIPKSMKTFNYGDTPIDPKRWAGGVFDVKKYDAEIDAAISK